MRKPVLGFLTLSDAVGAVIGSQVGWRKVPQALVPSQGLSARLDGQGDVALP